MPDEAGVSCKRGINIVVMLPKKWLWQVLLRKIVKSGDFAGMWREKVRVRKSCKDDAMRSACSPEWFRADTDKPRERDIDPCFFANFAPCCMIEWFARIHRTAR